MSGFPQSNGIYLDTQELSVVDNVVDFHGMEIGSAPNAPFFADVSDTTIVDYGAEETAINSNDLHNIGALAVGFTGINGVVHTAYSCTTEFLGKKLPLVVTAVNNNSALL